MIPPMNASNVPTPKPLPRLVLPPSTLLARKPAITPMTNQLTKRNTMPKPLIGSLWPRGDGGRTGAGGDAVTRRLPATAAPLPREAYAAEFDDLFARRSQREGFRRYLEGLLLPAERNKTTTGLANTEPTVGAQHPRAQTLQWFLSESAWDAAAINARRLALLRADPATAPDAQGVLVIDEHGDRKWGRKTAHVGRQYLANLGKTDSGVVSVTSLWADEAVYWPVDYIPYTPKHHFATGKADPCAGRLVSPRPDPGTLAEGLPEIKMDGVNGQDRAKPTEASWSFQEREIPLRAVDLTIECQKRTLR